jgi:hypothetical protein
MANPNWSAGGGGFLRILGIIYLVRLIRDRRRARRAAQTEPGSAE